MFRISAYWQLMIISMVRWTIIRYVWAIDLPLHLRVMRIVWSWNILRTKQLFLNAIIIVWKHYIIMTSTCREFQQLITADVNTYPKAWIPVSTTKRQALKISDEYLPNLKNVQKYVPESIHKIRKLHCSIIGLELNIVCV